MFQALNINTKEVIATGTDRTKLAEKASKLAGREGYCIRPVNEEKVKLPSNWATADGEWWL